MNVNSELKKERTDWELVRALLERLRQMNNQKDIELWEFAGTECEETVSLEGQQILRRIIDEVGIERVVGVTDYGLDGIPNYQIHKESFQNFVEVLDNLIKQHLATSVQYDEAWKLLKGLAHLLNISNQFFVQREECAGLGKECDNKVFLENPFRVYLYCIINVAQLQDIVSDELYDNSADVGEQSFVKPYQICDWMYVDDLCNDLDVVEKFLKSMQTSTPEQFKFEIDVPFEGNCDVEMTLAQFVKYECQQQIK